jgi:DNA-binding response OmpR family regulator
MSALQLQVPSVALELSKLNLFRPSSDSPYPARCDEHGVRVLVISHHAEDDALLRRVLTRPEWLVRTARTLADASQALKRGAFSVAICESNLLDGSWRDFLGLAACMEHGPEVIVASRLAEASLWAEALNIGACDVLSKPFSPKEIIPVVGYAWRQWTSQRKQCPPPPAPNVLSGREDQRRNDRGHVVQEPLA